MAVAAGIERTLIRTDPFPGQCQIMADQRRQTNWAEESWIKPHEKATATGVHRLRADEKAKIVYYVHSQSEAGGRGGLISTRAEGMGTAAERTRPLTMDLDTGLLLHDLQAVEKSAAMDLG